MAEAAEPPRTGLCLSIRQPWPWLILRPDVKDPERRAALTELEIKNIENRKWSTKVRGWIGIHAGKKFDREGYDVIKSVLTDVELPPPHPIYYQMGGIVGRVCLVDCVTESSSPWFAGPYGFVLTRAEPLEFRPCRGLLGFFRPDLKVPNG